MATTTATATTAPRSYALSAPSTARTQTIAAEPLARETGDQRTYQALSASDLNPSGFYLTPDEDLTITVHNATATTHRLVVGAPDAAIDEAERTPREYDLTIGSVTVNDPYGGPVYWKVVGEYGHLRATIGKTATRMPFFLHGSTTEAEFQAQLEERKTPYVELVSSHALITIQHEAALRFRGQDHAALMETYEDIIGIEDSLAGLDDTTTVHRRLPYRYHFVTRAAGIEGVGAYATHGHMLFPAPIQDRLLTVDALRLRGWGTYHELGHQHQQTVYKPTDLTESTVNWYSLAVNRSFATKYGQAPRLHVPEANGESVWTTAPPKIDSQSVDFLDTFTLMEQLVMFEQLRLHYGEEFLPKVHRLVREEKPEPGDFSDNDYRLGMLALYLSKAAGNDLRDYLGRWGVMYAPRFDDRIAKLNLPVPEIDLTTIRDLEGLALARTVLADPAQRAANGIPD